MQINRLHSLVCIAAPVMPPGSPQRCLRGSGFGEGPYIAKLCGR